ncbi:MAG: cyclic nucleotide-binding domain-containing protein [Chloroflexi bacterium]|nr:cyclic nucleotide-binding domain-containing protein [Chloroflexota bacterium]
MSAMVSHEVPLDLVSQISQIPLFSGLYDDDLIAVAEIAKREEYPAGRVICRQGETGHVLYLVEVGELRVIHIDPQGAEAEVGRMRDGDHFGETSLLLGEPHDATIQVVRDARLLTIDKADLDTLLSANPGLLDDLKMRPDVARKRRARHFRWQDEDEIIILNLHKHSAILISHLSLPIFILLVDVLGFGYWYAMADSAFPLVLGAILAIPPVLLGAFLIIDQQNDNYVVTSKRVLHEERIPLIRELRTEAPLRTIQDIQQTREGIWARLFNYGDLIIETAGQRGHVVFRQIPDPASVRDAIFEQIQRVRAGARATERAAIHDTLQQQFRSRKEASEEPPAPQPEPGRRYLGLAVPHWLQQATGLVRYFIPPMRYEVGDTITWRKHWIALLKPIAIPTILVILSAGITVFLLGTGAGSPFPILIGYGAVMIFLTPWWLWRFDNWQNDIYQVTSTRIIDVERLPFYIREDRREASLGMIQNISLQVPGILGKLLNYGSVTIETAASGQFTFDMVWDPRSVQQEIFRRMDAFQRMQARQAAEQRRNELLDWFAVYDQIRGSGAEVQSSTSPQEAHPL